MKRLHHPSPQWMRESIELLDGEWEVNGHPINVPYAPQSRASGYGGKVGDTLHYSRLFTVSERLISGGGGTAAGKPAESSSYSNHILLHFGAVDQIAEVSVNGHIAGRHEGGYLAFCYDITELVETGRENLLEVTATDTLSHFYPYGKQRKDYGGMWYTPVSGIWQSVWIEYVPARYLASAEITPDMRGFRISVNVAGATATVGTPGQTNAIGGESAAVYSDDEPDIRLRLWLPEGRRRIAYELPLSGGAGRIDIAAANRAMCIDEQPRLWTPEQPYLYEMELIYGEDRVRTYTALREISVREIAGVRRVCLNGSPIFLHGLLDQGYFPEGIYTAPEPEAYERDIVRCKALGYNFLRKHIKVEPEAFYYAADALGILVMQDMVNSGPYEYFSETIIPNLTLKKRPDTLFKRADRARKDFFINHSHDTVRQLYNHPCIIAYTIFNEGWGQFESDRLYELMREWDSTRLIDSTSGWFAQQKSDFHSEHIYFRNVKLPTDDSRPLLLSECGGYAYGVDGHGYHRKPWTVYGAVKSREELTERIRRMYIEMVMPAINGGLCGCVYTQLSDVEEEINGIFTYDREVCKVIPDEMRLLARTLKDILYIECTGRG